MSRDHCDLYDLPMVFGTETEFGFSCGKILNEEKAAFFPPSFPHKILNLILKIVAQRTGAFIRDPGFPWERDGLNHLGSLNVKFLTEAAISENLDSKEFVSLTKISPKDVYLGEVGIFLPNGSRLYIDGAHLEYSIGECREPYEVVCGEKAMEQILAETVIEAQKICGQEIFLFKNNTDYKNNSYGCHENYLLRSEFFNRLYEENLWSSAWLSFIVTSIIYTGSGKAGYESGLPCFYQISQRADHLERVFSSSSMTTRPIIHYRPEPLADPQKWGRFHVILDDSNMSEWSIYLKIGTKALVLNMLQSQYFRDSIWFGKHNNSQYRCLFLSDPVKALQFISRDLTCKKPLEMNRGGASALEIQKAWLALVKDFYSSIWECRAKWIPDIIQKWDQVLNWIEKDDPILDSILDWRIKKQLIERHFIKRDPTRPISKENAQSIDIHFHDISRKGFYNRLSEIDRFVRSSDIENAKTNPSSKTRAWLRGRFFKWLPYLSDVSWELLIFKLRFGDFETIIRLDPDPLFSAQPEIKQIFKETEYEEFCRKFLSWYLNHKNLRWS